MPSWPSGVMSMTFIIECIPFLQFVHLPCLSRALLTIITQVISRSPFASLFGAQSRHRPDAKPHMQANRMVYNMPDSMCSGPPLLVMYITALPDCDNTGVCTGSLHSSEPEQTECVVPIGTRLGEAHKDVLHITCMLANWHQMAVSTGSTLWRC